MMLGYDDFRAAWRLRRYIDDRYSNQQGDMVGAVGFRTDRENRLKYNELGKVRFGDGPIFQAERSYFWEFQPSQIVVTFDDEKPFHSFVPQGEVSGTDHLCGDDYYRVAYDFTQWPSWTATWTVTGPRKDYTSVSHYDDYRKQRHSKEQHTFRPLEQFVVKPLSD